MLEYKYKNQCKIPRDHNLINKSKGIPYNNILRLQVHCIKCTLSEINYENNLYYYHSIDNNLIYICHWEQIYYHMK